MRKNEKNSKRIHKKIGLVYLHPFVISIFPFLFFINYNKDQMFVNMLSIVGILILILIFTFLIYGINLFLFKDLSKASFFSFIFIIIFFYYGHVEYLIDRLVPNFNINFSLSAFSPTKEFIYFDIGISKILYVIFTLFLIYVYLKVSKAPKIPFYIHKTLILFSIVLVSYNLVNLSIYFSNRELKVNKDRIALIDENTSDLPDIYYIIPDSYARSDVLRDVFGYDNSEFIDFLKSNGFYVAEKSNSNYAHTFLSLSSSLNMDYIDHLLPEIGDNLQDISKPLSLLSENSLAKYLQKRGYVFVNFSSDGGITGNIKIADYTMQNNSLLRLGSIDLKIDDFFISYLKTTAIYPLYRLNLIEFQRRQVLYVFDNLYNLDHIAKPKFVLAHIIIPHPPYIFDKNGDLPEKESHFTRDIETDKVYYVNQLQFTNIKLQESFSKILSKDKNTLIIIQADHGPSITLGKSFETNLIPEENISGVIERMAIFNAYYFPDGDYSTLSENITPVNTFRIILNKYFNENLDLLENKVYISDYSKLYKFWDVVDLIN